MIEDKIANAGIIALFSALIGIIGGVVFQSIPLMLLGLGIWFICLLYILLINLK